MSKRRRFDGNERTEFKVSKRVQLAPGHNKVAVYNLSSDILYIIFSFLDANDLAKACNVCRRWKEVGYHPSLWKDKIIPLMLFGTSAASHNKCRGIRCRKIGSISILHLSGYRQLRTLLSYVHDIITKLAMNYLSLEDHIFSKGFTYQMSKLRSLDVSGTKLTIDGFRTICAHVPQLEKLEMLHTPLDCLDACMAVIASNLPKLQCLDVSYVQKSKISWNGLSKLSKLPLKKLGLLKALRIVDVVEFTTAFPRLEYLTVSASSFQYLPENGGSISVMSLRYLKCLKIFSDLGLEDDYDHSQSENYCILFKLLAGNSRSLQKLYLGIAIDLHVVIDIIINQFPQLNFFGVCADHLSVDVADKMIAGLSWLSLLCVFPLKLRDFDIIQHLCQNHPYIKRIIVRQPLGRAEAKKLADINYEICSVAIYIEDTKFSRKNSDLYSWFM